jgi:hypothetical protein
MIKTRSPTEAVTVSGVRLEAGFVGMDIDIDIDSELFWLWFWLSAKDC